MCGCAFLRRVGREIGLVCGRASYHRKRREVLNTSFRISREENVGSHLRCRSRAWLRRRAHLPSREAKGFCGAASLEPKEGIRYLKYCRGKEERGNYHVLCAGIVCEVAAEGDPRGMAQRATRLVGIPRGPESIIRRQQPLGSFGWPTPASSFGSWRPWPVHKVVK